MQNETNDPIGADQDHGQRIGMLGGKVEKNELLITPEIKKHWGQIKQWTFFFSYISFFYFFIASIRLLNNLSKVQSGWESLDATPVLAFLVILLLGGLFLTVLYLIAIYQYRFAKSIETALEFNETDTAEIAFNNLKKYYRLNGIITFAFVGIVLISFLVNLVLLMQK